MKMKQLWGGTNLLLIIEIYMSYVSRQNFPVLINLSQIDYSKLYYDTIHGTLADFDVTRPFWPSSPSNGFTAMDPLVGIWVIPLQLNGD